MQYALEARRPRVFLSFAGSDRATAKRLGRDLREHRIDAFIDNESIVAGGNAVLTINSALAQSDYYVLLWSHATVDRPWVDAEWSAAWNHELAERRSFLFIVRLDKTPMPPLLAPRRHLDAFDGNWDAVVQELIATWHRDWAMRNSGTAVLPAPCQPAADSAVLAPTILLYVRNADLSVAHVLAVPEGSTGVELSWLVRTALALQDSFADPRWNVGLRFHYQLHYAGKPIPSDGLRSLTELGVTDGATIDLEVQIEQFGPAGSSSEVTYRGSAPRDLSPAMLRSLVNAAFAHLIPWQGPSPAPPRRSEWS